MKRFVCLLLIVTLLLQGCVAKEVKISTKIASLYATISAQDSLTPALKNVRTGLGNAKADLASFMTTAGMVTGALVGAGAAVKKLADGYTVYADQVKAITRLTGMQLEGASRLIQAADDMSVSQSTLTSALQFAVRQGYEPSTEWLGKMADKISAMPPGAKRAEEAIKLFGRQAGPEMLKMMEQGSAGINKATAAIANNLIMTGEGYRKAQAYKKALDDVADSWTGIKYAAADSGLLPFLATGLKLTTLTAESTQALVEGHWSLKFISDLLAERFESFARIRGTPWDKEAKVGIDANTEALGDFKDQLSAITNYGKQYTDTLESQKDALKEYSANVQYFTWLHKDGATYIKQLEDGLVSVADAFGKNSEEYKKADKWLEQTKRNYLGAAGAIDYNKDKLKELSDAQNKQTAEWMLNTLTQKLGVDGISDTEMAFLLQYQVDTGLLSANAAKRAQDAWDMSEKITAAVDAMPGAKYIDIWLKANFGDFAGVSNTPTANTVATSTSKKGVTRGAGVTAGPQMGASGLNFLPPGGSAIVGDSISGAPTGYEEMIIALPGGGVRVLPNSKIRGRDTRGLPHFAKESGGGAVVSTTAVGGYGGNTPWGGGYLTPNTPAWGGGYGTGPTTNPNIPSGGSSVIPAVIQQAVQSAVSASASITANATAPVASAAVKISESGEQTARATVQNTQASREDSGAILSELQKLNRFNKYELPRMISSVVARNQ